MPAPEEKPTEKPKDEFAIWADHVARAVVIDLPAPMQRLAFPLNDAMALRNAIDEQIGELIKKKNAPTQIPKRSRNAP